MTILPWNGRSLWTSGDLPAAGWKVLPQGFVDHCHELWSSETSPLRSMKRDQPKQEWKPSEETSDCC